MRIGVLGLQGAVREHVQAIEACGADAVMVKKVEQLQDIDGLVLPGGESTTMRRLIDRYGFLPSLKEFAKEKPIFGTCAGMILLAKEIEGDSESHIGAMNIAVVRNAFGRQQESFEMPLSIKGVGNDFMGVFIRAPFVKSIGEHVEVLAEIGDSIVAVREANLLAAAFHPELTDDNRMMEYFIGMVADSVKK